MGYCNDDAPDHEGWVAHTFADGQISSGTSTGGGVYLDGYAYLPRDENDSRTWAVIDPAYLRPYGDITGWVVRCECGWKGTIHPLANERPEHIAEPWNEPTDERENTLMDEWRAHIAPEVRTSRVSDLADRINDLHRELTGAVREARSNGASWADLGRALGVTKQAAQQRYGD